MTSNREIVAENLVKKYGDFTAVDGVSFNVESGEIFGFLGPNGAGKSTTVSMLTTLSLPTAGSATVGGYDVVDKPGSVRRVAGVALQEIGLDPIMKSMELLTIQGQSFGMSRKQARERAHELLTLVKLDEFTERQVGKYSGGMQRKLDLAMALMHEPAILFLDEPTTGLDPAARRDVWDEIRRLNTDKGMTIFLTTQYLEEADLLAERIAIIDDGQIVARGTPDDLKAEVGGESINVTMPDADTAQRAGDILSEMADDVKVDGETLLFYRGDAAAAVAQVVRELENHDLSIETLTIAKPTLDDVFLQVTGQRFQEADDDTEDTSELQSA
jgi:ABC-2 type transport system ATP-binding protein